MLGPNCGYCGETIKKGDYECAIYQRDQARASAMSAVLDEEFTSVCPTCPQANTVEAVVRSGCGQDLTILHIDETGEAPVEPTAAPQCHSVEAATHTEIQEDIQEEIQEETQSEKRGMAAFDSYIELLVEACR